MANQKAKQEIVFPEEVSENISKILKRYELEEPLKKVEEKLYQGKLSPAGIIAKTTWQLAEGKIKMGELPALLQKKLNIPAETARKLTKDIKREVVDLAEKIPEKVPSAPPEKPSPEEKPSPRKDIYREPIE
ncbi:hypothetical protein J7K42_01520 [bacterium]|nr:hypothetical protein [bacterium]